MGKVEEIVRTLGKLLQRLLQTTAREGSFASTRWTVVHQAADSQTASQHALSALSELCQIYWRPVYVFLRRQGIQEHDAQDLTQGFFAELIDSRAYTRADPMKGKFRSFLLGTLKHFVAHVRDYDRAQKRGSGNIPVQLDEAALRTVESEARLREVKLYIERALADRRLREENRLLARVAVDRSSFDAIIGRSAAMKGLFELIERRSTTRY